MSTNKQANRLIHEKSPYLLQHAYNPVNWFSWSDEAFEKAKAEDKPIFLSIGYSTCHWCHVMERESFEDEEVAELLNRDYISIKVDREERPDIDTIYMSVCQTMTGHGGWPLTILMTHDMKPFFAGTYFPKQDRMGMTGLVSLLHRVSRTWKNNRNALVKSSEQIIAALEKEITAEASVQDVSEDILHQGYMLFSRSFDKTYGGFGSAPKFPTPHNLMFLLRYWYYAKEPHALEMVEETLDAMRKGGIYDHIGFGFSRYSTDRKWLVPHFEKMLYDNALLAVAYLEAYQATKKTVYADTARQIFTYVLRDMTSPEGAFYSAEDADSEGEEGLFYVWTPDEIADILGKEEGERFCKIFDITDYGNFEGKNIPNLIKSELSKEDTVFIEACRQKLFSHREKRIHPYKDDKILAAWNSLMIAALALGSRILREEKYKEAAENAYRFIDANLTRKDGRLFARYRDGQSEFPAYLDDYAFLVWGLIELYESTYKPEYLEKALKLNNEMLHLFRDEKNGGLYIYGNDSEQLILRPKEVYDGATPSGNSVASMNFIRLARLTGDPSLEELANEQFKVFSKSLTRYPAGYAFMLSALMFARHPGKEIVIVDSQDSQNRQDLLDTVNLYYQPFTSSLFFSESHKDSIQAILPFISDYKTVNGMATAYVCENRTCREPVTDASLLGQILSNQ